MVRLLFDNETNQSSLHVLVCKHVDVTKEHEEINKVISINAVCHTISLYFGAAKHFFPC